LVLKQLVWLVESVLLLNPFVPIMAGR